MLKIECPKCGTPLEVPDDKAQSKGRCSTCETKFLIPAFEDDEIEIIEEERDDDGGELTEDFIARWLKILSLITVGLMIGIVIGFYVGRFTTTPDDGFYQSEPSIKSRGDTIDPFGIDNN